MSVPKELPMALWKVKYGWSLAISFGLVLTIGGVASIPDCANCDKGMLLMLPGALLAAFIFPEGVNSNGGILYLVLAGVLDILLLSLPVFWAWSLIERRRGSKI